MIQILPTTLGATAGPLYSVIIDEKLCQGYDTDNLPVVTIGASNVGTAITAGSTLQQKIMLSVTIVYQPYGSSSETKTKTFAEVVTIPLVSTATNITPTAGAVTNVTPTKKCCGNIARGVKFYSSLSVAIS